jgi:hypothetical protein
MPSLRFTRYRQWYRTSHRQGRGQNCRYRSQRLEPLRNPHKHCDWCAADYSLTKTEAKDYFTSQPEA